MFNLPESVVFNKNNYQIHTPLGFESFLGINKITKNEYIHLKFNNGKELKCSEDHPLLTIEGIVRAKDITKKQLIETEDSIGCFVVSKRLIRKKIDLYDIVNSGQKHLYYSNGIVSHNCQFLGSSNTLIDGQKLATLFYKDPVERMKIGNDNYLDIYEQPIKGDDETVKDHIYLATVDVAEGKGLDASTVHIMDISTTPYRQVAKYSNSFISPVLFPTVIHTIAKHYNDAFVLVEINNNPQIADILINEMEYENVLRVSTGNKQSQTLSTGFGRGIQNGLKMSVQTKKVGCLNLKTLVESDKLFIQDFDTVSELTTFVADNNSWSAEEGANDDNVMALVIFGWASTQKYFRDIVDHDLRKQLQLEKFNRIEENDIPAPMMDDGLTVPFMMDGDGDIWFEGDYESNWRKHFHNF